MKISCSKLIRKSGFISTALLLTVVISLNGCGGGKKNDGKPALKQIVVGVSQEPDTLNRLFMEMMVSTDLYFAFSRDLAEYDSDWNLLPSIAEEIPSLENGGWEIIDDKRMKTTWKIREDAVWEDGKPVIADDFIFAFEVIMDDRQPVVSRDIERRIESMESPDSKTLVVNWKEHYAYADQGHRKLPSHVLREVYEKDPEKFADNPFGRKPLGNGPFSVKEWEAGSHVILARNENFYGQKPWFDQLVYKVIPNTNTLEANIASDTIQAITTTGLTFDQAVGIEKRHSDNIGIHYTEGLVWEHIDCNLDSPLLSDKRMRHAIMHALNRQVIMDTLFKGRLSVAHSWLPDKHYGYNPNVKKYEHDPKKATALLDEMGWVMGDDGIRAKDGEKLELIIMTTAGNKVREQVQQIMQSQLRAVGIALEIRNQPAKVYFGETLRYRKFPHLAMYAWVMSPTSDGESLWTIKNIPSEENNWQGQNNSGWRNEEANRIDSLVPATIDMDERQRLLIKQQELWTEDIPSIPMYFDVDTTATRKDFQNWKPTGTQTPVTWNCEQWKFAK